MSEFASWLVAARKQSKLSQAQLAERVGVSQAQVSQWENGRLEPKPELLAQVKEILGEPPRNAKPSKSSKASKANGAVLGFEQKLWEAADKLRGSMDPGEYKHVVLGLIFLKYISDAFEERYARLQSEQGADPEDRYEYEAANVFWVPKEARWSELQKAAKQPTIGVLVDKAMDTIEKQNPSLKGTLPKDYARPALDKPRNFAWLQHIVHHLAPTGVAGVVLANGSMSSQQSGEGVIRQNMVEADIVDCMVALPAQLFYAV
ncbi:MAG: type I restriction-modification system subunit M N-terminal domain-containing protein, partial [Myxococcales bacterium]